MIAEIFGTVNMRLRSSFIDIFDALSILVPSDSGDTVRRLPAFCCGESDHLVFFDINASERFFSSPHITGGLYKLLYQIKKLIAVLDMILFVIRSAKRHFRDLVTFPTDWGDNPHQRFSNSAIFSLLHFSAPSVYISHGGWTPPG
jgi:hypothetical protein